MNILRNLIQARPKARDKIEPGSGLTATIKVVDSPCHHWKKAERGLSCSVVRKPFIYRDAKLFTIGSCFAAEIKEGLRRLGYNTYPKYREMALDPAVETVDWIPQHDHIAHYNTFSIRQEFEKSFCPRDYDIDDFICLSGSDNTKLSAAAERVWQDPYRKKAYATSEVRIRELSRKIDDAIRDAILACDAYIITLGLTEVWRNDRNGLYLNQAPEHSLNGFTFEQSTYEQNYENMRRICSLVREHYPTKPIVVSVSPVPLKQTFTDLDVVTANMESKCTLRAVAAALSRQFENVTYWPSFEVTFNRDVFRPDGRHVRSEVVEKIVERFIDAHAV